MYQFNHFGNELDVGRKTTSKLSEDTISVQDGYGFKVFTERACKFDQSFHYPR